MLVERRTSQLNELNKYLSVEVDERKKSEILLKDVNASKDKLYSIIAHDLKSPFNTLIGFSDLLIEEWDSFTDDKRYEMIKMIQSTSNNTFNLLINLLEWSRYQIGNFKYEPKRFGFYKLVIETYSQLKGQALLKNITIDLNTPSQFMAKARELKNTLDLLHNDHGALTRNDFAVPKQILQLVKTLKIRVLLFYFYIILFFLHFPIVSKGVKQQL